MFQQTVALVASHHAVADDPTTVATAGILSHVLQQLLLQERIYQHLILDLVVRGEMDCPTNTSPAADVAAHRKAYLKSLAKSPGRCFCLFSSLLLQELAAAMPDIDPCAPVQAADGHCCLLYESLWRGDWLRSMDPCGLFWSCEFMPLELLLAQQPFFPKFPPVTSSAAEPPESAKSILALPVLSSGLQAMLGWSSETARTRPTSPLQLIHPQQVPHTAAAIAARINDRIQETTRQTPQAPNDLFMHLGAVHQQQMQPADGILSLECGQWIPADMDIWLFATPCTRIPLSLHFRLRAPIDAASALTPT